MTQAGRGQQEAVWIWQDSTSSTQPTRMKPKTNVRTLKHTAHTHTHTHTHMLKRLALFHTAECRHTQTRFHIMMQLQGSKTFCFIHIYTLIRVSTGVVWTGTARTIRDRLSSGSSLFLWKKSRMVWNITNQQYSIQFSTNVRNYRKLGGKNSVDI